MNQTKLLEIEILAFGYKYGPAPMANFLLDVRYLKNPHYVPDLRPLTGLDEPVQQFIVANNPGARELLEQQVEMALAGYLEYGNDHEKLTFAFGCTGGKHRSRFCAVTCEAVVKRFVAARGLECKCSLVFLDEGKE